MKKFTALTDFVIMGVGTFKKGQEYPLGEITEDQLKGFGAIKSTKRPKAKAKAESEINSADEETQDSPEESDVL